MEPHPIFDQWCEADQTAPLLGSGAAQLVGARMSSMSDEWRPLGVDDEGEIAEYDALHDGVPDWMATAYWDWVYSALSTRVQFAGRNYPVLNANLTEQMGQTLKIPLPKLRDGPPSQDHRPRALGALQKHSHPLQVADYLLARNAGVAKDLAGILERSKSAYTVGTRAGKSGLVRRVAEGVQVAADAVMQRAGHAGARLAKAWEELYGLTPNPSEAYRFAILAVEDAAIPVVSSNNAKATLGTVLAQLENQKDWHLPMTREDPRALTGDVVIALIRMIWFGQHDRHGGQPSAPGNVSFDEAKVALSVAVTLVDWFSAGLARRTTT